MQCTDAHPLLLFAKLSQLFSHRQTGVHGVVDVGVVCVVVLEVVVGFDGVVVLVVVGFVVVVVGQ